MGLLEEIEFASDPGSLKLRLGKSFWKESIVEQFTIEVQTRADAGSTESRRLRSSGRIPCVVYSRGEKTLIGSVPVKEFVTAASAARRSQVFTFKSGDSALNGKAALVKEIQRDFIKGGVLHIDFQSLKDNEETVVSVDLSIVGESIGVKRDGGILTVAAHDVRVACLPKAIPSFIEVDIAPLEVGASVHARDLKLPAGVRLIDDEDTTIASVVISKFVEEAAPTAAVAAEGAAAPAPGAEAAPAADAAKADEKKGK